MILQASNLGQIVGRALYGALEPRRLDTIPVTAAVQRRWVDRRAQVRELLERLGSVKATMVAKELGLGNSHAHTLLAQWAQGGFLVRHGQQGNYIYTLAAK